MKLQKVLVGFVGLSTAYNCGRALSKTLVLRSRTAIALGILPLLFLLTLPALVQAQFIFTTNNGTITITRYTGSADVLTIPDAINGLPVTSIAANTFQNCTNLTSVTVPDSVTSIGYAAFFACGSLTNIMIPGSLINIGGLAFRGCARLTAITVDTNNPVYSSVDGVLFNMGQTTLIQCPEGKAGAYTIPDRATNIANTAFIGCWNLTNITIPSSVTSIGYEAFAACSGLTAITVDALNSIYSSVDGVLFNHSQTILVAYPGGIAGDYTIPDTVTSIGDAAFNSCSHLTIITIGTNVTSIGSYGFNGCTHLAEVYFKGNAPSVGQSAFGSQAIHYGTVYYMPGTTGWSDFSKNIYLPVVQWNPLVLFQYTTNNGTITIMGYTGSSGVVTIPSTYNGLSVTSIRDFAFVWSGILTSITIPNSVTNIGNYAFAWCWSLTSATIPDGVTSIGYDAFYNCRSLTNITIPNSVTSIGSAAFSSCWGLTNVTIGSGVTNIGSGAFGGCSRLSGVTLGTNVASLGAWAFNSCSSLPSITIPHSVSSIGDGVLVGCTSLTAITVDAPNAFYSSVDGVLFNKSQTMLVQYPGGKAGDYMIPNSVTSIGDHAFGYGVSLTSITIPNCVTSIGVNAFQNCTSLSGVTLPDSVTSIGGWAFASCTRLTDINVDAINVVYSSEHGVLFNKSQSTLIEYPGGKAGGYTIPDSVTSIVEAAFYDCSSLASVTIPNGVTDIGASAFASCTNMTSITIGYSVIGIGDRAFWNCTNLTGLYFQGNAPLLGGTNVFIGDNNATVYYLPGTTGWGPTFGGRPTALWFLPNPLILNKSPSFGVRTNRFGFIISWATNIPIVVEACTNLASARWTPLQSCTITNGSIYFSDPQWTNYPARFYRIRSP
jgi:hypothetical protein